ncbi:exopolysaccharide biosynthesis polyprenyl glycosylphosphotransferase [Terasakiella sp.]|uniref:exopolysaccharide biosynthesis polyprenyl glycosylphosphotransferase n=1 Tax=Terasakiella sp. TaxID=2034861 RepID=UPI003AA876D7
MNAKLKKIEDRINAIPVWKKTTIAFCITLGIDFLSLTASVLLARYMRWLFVDYPNTEILFEWNVSLFVERLWLYGAFIFILLLVFTAKGHYTRRRMPIMLFNEIFLMVLIVGVADFASAYLLQKAFPRLWVALTWGMAPFILLFGRYVSIAILKRMRCWKLPVLFFGDLNGLDIVKNLIRNEQFSGYYLAESFLKTNGKSYLNPKNEYQTVNLRDFGRLKIRHNLRVLICFSKEKEHEQQEVAVEALRHGHQVMLLPSYFQLPIFHSNIEPIFGEHYLLMRMQNALDNWFYKKIKRIFDLIMASILLILTMPILVLAAMWICSVSKGPALFRQKRIGLNGENFPCLKLRTMEVGAHQTLVRWKRNAPDTWAEYEKNNFKLDRDPRLIKGAHFLRKYSIDELPQLLNVVKGDMSMVGPRPLLAREIKSYGVNFENYTRTIPGITGLWQVNGRSHTTFTKRAELDSWYIQNWSVWLDIIITLKTFKIVLLGLGERH